MIQYDTRVLATDIDERNSFINRNEKTRKKYGLKLNKAKN